MANIVPLSSYPLIQNARCYTPGRIQSRPPLAKLTSAALGSPIHSLRRLNDPTQSAYTRIAGSGTGLYYGQSTLSLSESGYSGNPLSLIPFEPPSTPQPWMYLMDLVKGGRKVNVNGTAYQQGIAPPLTPTTAALGPPTFDTIDLFNGATAGAWGTTGTAGSLTENVAGQISTTITAIIYDENSVGWASIYPASIPADLNVADVFLLIDTGAAQETAITASALGALSASTITTITYNSGSTGLCTITPASNSFTAGPGQIVKIGSGGTAEYVQVLSLTFNTSGTVSFTCVTVGTHASSEALNGYLTYRCWLTKTHTAGAALVTGYFSFQVTTGTGLLSENELFNLALVNARPQQTTDNISLWLYLDTPANITNFVVEFDVDPSKNNFTQNYYYFDAGTTVAAYNASTWNQLNIPISSFLRTGASPTDWANVAAVGVKVVASGTVNIQISQLTIFGQYGPDPGNGPDYTYVQRFRSSVTGATSNAGPANRVGVDPSTESVVVTGIEAVDTQVDTADFFRLGGTLTNFTYIGSSPCSATIVPQVLDVYADTDLAAAEVLETDNDQPFTVPGLPVSGICNVNGYTVSWVSGGHFNPAWPQGTGVIINGQPTTLYMQPASSTSMQALDVLPVATNVPFQVPEPVLLGQSMQVMFGVYGEGNAGITMFAVGNEDNAGTIFWTNGNNPDSASSANNLAITSPSEALMSGDVFADQPFVFSFKRLFRLVPNFSTDANGNPIGGFLAYDEGSGYGLFAPWAMCVGPRIYYRASDGIRESALGGTSISLTDPDLSLLFPHGESAGVAVQIGTVTVYPPDDTQPAKQRLSWGNSHLFFNYVDTNGDAMTLVWNPVSKTWSTDTSSFGILVHYADEAVNTTVVLAAGDDGNIWQFQNSGSIDQPFVFRMPTVGDQGTYLCCRDLYLAAALGGTANIVINVDDVDYTVPVGATSGGGYQRLFYNLPDLKGQSWSWGFTSTNPAEIYLKATQAHVKEWAAREFTFAQPYRDLDREVKP